MGWTSLLLITANSIYTCVKKPSSGILYMKQSPKTAQVNLRLSPELKKAAEQAAVEDNRSLTSLIEKLLMDHFRKTGQTIGKPARKRK